MAYYYINTDWDARDDSITCDIWFEKRMAFAGDRDIKWNHTSLFKKLVVGDILFMYHSIKDRKNHKQKGFVGVGIVTEEWDGECYEGSHRLLYDKKEKYEYRIGIDWYKNWRDEPKSGNELGLPVSPNYWCNIDDEKYKVTERLSNLIKR